MVSRTKKLTLTALGTVMALALATVVWVLVASDFAFTEERVTIEGPRGELNAVLVKPTHGDGPHGLVVFVHDDGPAEADRDDAYKPLWNAFAEAGYASLSWDKPGVNDAPGDWLQQSMRDRAAEVEAAISWAYTRPDLDTTRLGLWGLGQAGWVIPDVLGARNDLRFAALVGPAVDWQHQQEFRARSGITPEAPTAARRAFDERNRGSNSVNSLRRISIPLLLILGGQDRDVDVSETEAAYRRNVRPDLLTVKRFDDATHAITRNDIEYRDDFRVAARRLFAPSTVYAPGYLDSLRIFAKRVTE